jgi:hypothetical protein
VKALVRALTGLHGEPDAADYAGAAVILALALCALTAMGWGAAVTVHGLLR